MPERTISFSTTMAANPITLHGALDVQDMRRLFYFGMFRHPFWIVFGGLGLLAVLGLLSAAALAEGANGIGILVNATPFVFLLLFWFGAIAVLPRWSAASRFNAEKQWREPATYEFTADEIQIIRPSESTVMKWTLVTAVRETKNLFLIQLGEAAVPLPKRFFADIRQMEDWKRLVLSQVSSQQEIAVKGLAARWC